MTSDRGSQSAGGRWALVAAAMLLLAGAGWRAITLEMASFEAFANPAKALEWRPGFAEAELIATEAMFRDRETPTGRDEPVRAAVRSAPLYSRGYRLLAREAELRGEKLEAVKLYRIAAARGPRDLPSLAWMAHHELEQGQFASALARYDQMMRVQPEIGLRLAPTLLAVAAHAPAQTDFARVLQRSPPWREDFMPRLMRQTQEAAAIFALVEQLRLSPGGLSDDELRMWLDRLAAEKQWGSAYLTWVQSLTAEESRRIGNVYNGSFELEPRQLGFDWRFQSVPGARIDRTQVTGAKESLALRVEFDGRRVPFQNVRQMLALAPGDYRFRGRARLDDLRSDRGLVWTLTCAEDGRQLAETEPVSGRREWHEFELKLSVPAQDCGGQWLTLRVPARIAAEQRVGGVAWFDDLQMKSD